MKEYAKHFYKSIKWQDCRNAYSTSVGGLCERCLKAGEYTPGEIVHHKIPITPENINNPEITLSWDNLELLCRDCHSLVHNGSKRRYKVDAYGHVVAVM